MKQARSRWQTAILLFAGLLWLTLALNGCGEDENNPAAPTAPAQTRADCQGCHTNEAMLKATALPDSSAGDPSGEG